MAPRQVAKPLSAKPGPRDDEQEIAGVLEHQQDEHLAGCCNQLGTSDMVIVARFFPVADFAVTFAQVAKDAPCEIVFGSFFG